MIETGFYQALIADPSITAFVGSNVFRVFRKAMPVPSVVFTLVSRSPIHSFDGRNGLEIGRYQFDAYASDADTAIGIADAIKTLLVPLSTLTNNYPYPLPDGSGIASAMIHNEEDMSEEVGSGGGYLFRRLLDIEFSFVSS